MSSHTQSTSHLRSDRHAFSTFHPSYKSIFFHVRSCRPRTRFPPWTSKSAAALVPHFQHLHPPSHPQVPESIMAFIQNIAVGLFDTTVNLTIGFGPLAGFMYLAHPATRARLTPKQLEIRTAGVYLLCLTSYSFGVWRTKQLWDMRQADRAYWAKIRAMGQALDQATKQPIRVRTRWYSAVVLLY